MRLNTKKLDRLVQNFVRKVSTDKSLKAFLDTDFNYYYYSKKVGYSILVSERMDSLFLEYAFLHGLKVDCGIFALSLLHEVGHHMTIEGIDQSTYDFCQEVKETLTDSDEDANVYFDLEDERLATKWAIDYINTHVKEVEDFTVKFSEALAEFVEKYDIDFLSDYC